MINSLHAFCLSSLPPSDPKSISLSSRKELPFNSPPANELASQSTQQPRPVCTWSAHAPQSGLGPSPLSYPRYSPTLTATATAAGELFLFGGWTYGGASDDIFVLNAGFLYENRRRGSHPRGGHGAVLIDTSTLLIFGGHEGVRPVPNRDSLYLLDLGTSGLLISNPTLADRCVVLQYRERGPASWSMVLGPMVVTTIPQAWSVPSSLSSVVNAALAGITPVICGHSI
jgi:hypothetical protein